MNGWAVAVLGAGTDLGRELTTVLRERAIPVDTWALFDEAGDDNNVDDEAPSDAIRPLAETTFDGMDVVFVCAYPKRASEWAAEATSAGAVVIDLTRALASDGAPIVVPEVNAEVIDDGGVGPFVSPVPSAVALSVVLKPIHDAAELKRIVLTAFEPAFQAGRAGVDELAEQTRDLLSGRSPDMRVFPHRLAFNLIAQSGEFLPGGRTRGEWLVESHTRAALGLPDLPIAVTSVSVPVFFGHAAAVSIETERPLDADAATALLRQSPGVLLHDARGSESYPTLADVTESDATHVGRVRDDPTVPFGLALWIAIDTLRKGGVVNAVQIAERVIRGLR